MNTENNKNCNQDPKKDEEKLIIQTKIIFESEIGAMKNYVRTIGINQHFPEQSKMSSYFSRPKGKSQNIRLELKVLFCI